MIRWFLFFVAVAFAALGLLTVFRIPDWLDWRLAAVACSFGYLLAIVPVLAGVWLAYLPRVRGSPAFATGALAALGTLLLLQPCVRASLIAVKLPQRLASQFGPVDMALQPFTFSGLFKTWPAAAPKSTFVYTGRLKLDFYPAIGRTLAPCVIVIHGGGWDSGDRGQIPQLNNWLARAGYAVADISYRLAPEFTWPAQRLDVAAAVAYLKGHAAALAIDASRLVLLGRSAGGQIAEATAYAIHDPAIRGVVALYAPSDMRFAWTGGRPDDALNSPRLLQQLLGGTPETVGAVYENASGYFLANAGSPATLLVHGTLDTLASYKQSERMAARLEEKGVTHLLVTLPWASHALEYNLSSPSGQLTTYALAWFLAARCR